jgi:hypothetical protein
MLVDPQGHLVLLHLPGVIPDRLAVVLITFRGVLKIYLLYPKRSASAIAATLKHKAHSALKTRWGQDEEKHGVLVNDSMTLPSGYLSVSPAYEAQGHVSCQLLFKSHLTEPIQTELVSSLSIRSKVASEAVRASEQLDRLINIIVYLTHPGQFNTSLAARTHLRAVGTSDVKYYLGLWKSIFTGHTWVLNRKIRPHRDGQGFKAGYDYLTVLGTAFSQLHLRDINVTLDYRPGTVVGLPGRVLTHEVKDWGDGDRICIARWLRKNLLLRRSIPGFDWPLVSSFMDRFGW